jgi:NAD(P)-dependent dehydrogenase (short-subunit alcohol dehydrogenase family)
MTGGSAEIGKAIAGEFVREGAKVVICGRRREKLSETLDELRRNGGEVFGMQADVGASADVKRLFEEALGTYGKLDICVNKAAVIRQAKIVDMAEEDWDRLVRNNLKSVVWWFFGPCRRLSRRERSPVYRIPSSP